MRARKLARGFRRSKPGSRSASERLLKTAEVRKRCARLPRVSSRLLPGAVLSILLAGCRNGALPEGASADRDVVAGRRIFERKCASCHNGNGDGRTIVAGHFPYANLID